MFSSAIASSERLRRGGTRVVPTRAPFRRARALVARACLRSSRAARHRARSSGRGAPCSCRSARRCRKAGIAAASSSAIRVKYAARPRPVGASSTKPAGRRPATQVGAQCNVTFPGVVDWLKEQMDVLQLVEQSSLQRSSVTCGTAQAESSSNVFVLVQSGPMDPPPGAWQLGLPPVDVVPPVEVDPPIEVPPVPAKPPVSGWPAVPPSPPGSVAPPHAETSRATGAPRFTIQWSRERSLRSFIGEPERRATSMPAPRAEILAVSPVVWVKLCHANSGALIAYAFGCRCRQWSTAVSVTRPRVDLSEGTWAW